MTSLTWRKTIGQSGMDIWWLPPRYGDSMHFFQINLIQVTQMGRGHRIPTHAAVISKTLTDSKVQKGFRMFEFKA
jgi:hypothetical protein